MEARMKNPAMVLGVNPAIQTMMSPIYQSGLPMEILEFVGLRIGQMNNCELCVSQSLIRAENAPEINNRIEYVIDWQTSGKFSDAEKVALEMAEAVTELKHRYNSVPDALWEKVEAHFDEKQRAALVLCISIMNMFTRINVATRQLEAEWA